MLVAQLQDKHLVLQVNIHQHLQRHVRIVVVGLMPQARAQRIVVLQLLQVNVQQ